MNGGDEIAERDMRLKQLGADLARVDCLLVKPLEVQFEEWRNMWTGMIGTLFSLRQAVPGLVSSPRSFVETVNDARAVLQAVISGTIPLEQTSTSWWVGYWLNNVESRIDAILHQALQAGYECDGHDYYVYVLAGGIVKSACPKRECYRAVIKPRSSAAVVESIVKKDARNALVMVHRMAGGWKHKKIPETDLLPPKERWETYASALSLLTTLFLDFAQQQGVARLS